jgi:hypothetical protein
MSFWENKAARGVVQREAKQNLKKNLFVLILQFARCQIIFSSHLLLGALCESSHPFDRDTPSVEISARPQLHACVHLRGGEV